MVILLERRNPGANETPGLRRDPCQTMAFLPRSSGNGPPDIVKHAVYPVLGRRRLNGEACALPEVAQVCNRCGSVEVPHDQLVVRDFSCIPDCHVLKQATVCYQDVVNPGAHLLSSLLHGPCPVVLQPRLVPWEEVSAHFLYPRFCHRRRNLLVPRPTLRRGQIGVEIPDH